MWCGCGVVVVWLWCGCGVVCGVWCVVCGVWCVVWCGGVVVWWCGVVCGAAWHAEKNLRVYIQNVPVCTGTTRTCVTTCGRGAGTHEDVLNLHTEVFWTDALVRGGERREKEEGGSPSVLLTKRKPHEEFSLGFPQVQQKKPLYLSHFQV